MTKRLVEIDDEKLQAVRQLLGTTTLRATIDEALDEVLALEARRHALLEGWGLGTAPTDALDRSAMWR